MYSNTMPTFFDGYYWTIYETKYSENISQVSLWGEPKKHNFDVGDIFLICVLGIIFLLVLFVIILS